MRRAIGALVLVLSVGCSGGSDDDEPDSVRDGGRVERDGGVHDAGPRTDAGPRDGGPASGPDGSVTTGCVQISGDRDVVFDLEESVTRTGALTSNAMDLPVAKGGRGLLFFSRPSSPERPFASIPAMGASTYGLDLVPDRYDVDFVGTSCAIDAPPFCGRFHLGRDLDFTEGGDTPFEIPRVSIDGRVTLEGATLPDSSPMSRGRLVFLTRNTLGEPRQSAVDLGTSGDALYALEIPPGSYDVAFVGESLNCEHPTLPCNVALLAEDVDLTSAQTLDFDLTTYVLSGTLTQNGGALAEAPFSRGRIVIEAREDLPSAIVEIAPAGPATYSANVLAGTYTLRFRSLNGASIPTLPLGERALETDLEITASRTVDLDMETVRIGGIVRLDGALLPDVAPPTERGRIAFVDPLAPEGYAIADFSLLSTGPVIYDATLFAGTYDIVFSAIQCLPGLPCTNGAVDTSRAFTVDETYNVELSTRRVRGAVTVDGNPFPDANVFRGALTVIGDRGSGTTPFPVTGDATFDVRVFPGDYAFVVEPPVPGTCVPGMAPGIPCTSTSYGEQTIVSDANMDFDIQTATFSGRVTVEGEPLPMAGSRTLLLYAEDGRVTQQAIDEAGMFSVLVSHGRYGVQYRPGTTCAGAISGPRPCATQYLGRCN